MKNRVISVLYFYHFVINFNFLDGNGKRTRLVCIPAFGKTHSIAIVNLRTLDCKMLNFKIDGFEDMEE